MKQTGRSHPNITTTQRTAYMKQITRPILLALSLALVGCQADTEISGDGATTTTERPNTVRDEAIRSAATAPSTTAFVAPTTTAQTEGALGATFTVNPGDRKITAFTFRSPVTPTNQFTTPKAGMQFAAAEVQECAGPAGERFSPNRFDFELALTDNTRIRAGTEVQTPQLASSPLLPGDCIRGWVSFEVPTTATVRHIVYSVGNASAKWRVT